MRNLDKSTIRITLNELDIPSFKEGVGMVSEKPSPKISKIETSNDQNNVDVSKEIMLAQSCIQVENKTNTHLIQESINTNNSLRIPLTGKKGQMITRKDKALFDLFIYHLENQLKYTDPDFNLKSAARELGTNEKYLSTAINNCSRLSFNALVNRYRIAHAKKLIYEDVLTRQNLEEIAYLSGYGNRTTFYRVFTELEGVTPSRFRDNYNKDFTL